MVSIVSLVFISIYLKLSNSANYTAYIITSSSAPFNFILNKYDYISSASGNTKLLFQGNDGNFALYHNGSPQWSSNVAYRGADYVEITRTGDILIKNSEDNTIWTANTDEDNTPPYYLLVNEACAYLMDAHNYVLWNEGYGCGTTFPTFSPRPTAEPTTTPTLSPTLMSNLPTGFPTITPTMISSAPSQTPTPKPTTAPSISPTVSSGSPSTTPTLSPSTPPSAAPTMYPTVPTQSPTVAISLIEDVFSDDFVFDAWDSFGWLNDATVTDDLYHGPYYQDDGYFEMSRWFQCTSYSSVSIQYTLLCCKGNDHADVSVYINGDEMAHTYCDTTTDTSSYPKHAICGNRYYALTLEGIGNKTVTKYDAFYVSFKMHTWHDSDPVAVSDIKVFCGDAISDAPTKEPTVNPTHAPTTITNEPTLAPTDAPTIATSQPTMSPSVPTISPTSPTSQPTKAPSVSPTKKPTLPPTKQPSAAPTSLTTNPTMDPTVDPTTLPTLKPTKVPSVSPTKNPTLPPTKQPSASPTSLTTNPTPSPTGQRMIDDVFIDDFVFAANDFGWLNDATVTDNIYHGPYTDRWTELNRWFQCSSYSMVSVQYTLLCCKNNDHADVSIYINNTKIQQTYCDTYSMDWPNSYGVHSSCDWEYYQYVLTDIGSLITTKHESFLISFEIHTLHDNDPVGITGIKVFCGDAVSDAPTAEPTKPSRGPSTAPSARPTYELSTAAALSSTLWIEEDRSTSKKSSASNIIMMLFIGIFLGLVVGGFIMHLKKTQKEASEAQDILSESDKEDKKQSSSAEDDEVDDEKRDLDDEKRDEKGEGSQVVIVANSTNVELQRHRNTDDEDDSEELYDDVDAVLPVQHLYVNGDDAEGNETMTRMEPGQSYSPQFIHPAVVMTGSVVKTVVDADSGSPPK